MKENIRDLLKNGYYKLPKLLLTNYKKINLTELELVIIIYLINQNDLEFNPNQISKDLDMTLESVMMNIDNLIKNNIITIDSTKVGSIRKDIINLDNLYDKLLYLIINEEQPKKETDIYSIFESEFGRTLAPMEYEIINSWLETGYNKELILSALKEAVFNGVFKLNYIDKILFEWNKKGIKTSKDVEKDRTNHNTKKEEKKELYDYNWLEDE